MGINNYYQWEYIGKYDHFDILLVESEIVENKSQNWRAVSQKVNSF